MDRGQKTDSLLVAGQRMPRKRHNLPVGEGEHVSSALAVASLGWEVHHKDCDNLDTHLRPPRAGCHRFHKTGSDLAPLLPSFCEHWMRFLMRWYILAGSRATGQDVRKFYLHLL